MRVIMFIVLLSSHSSPCDGVSWTQFIKFINAENPELSKLSAVEQRVSHDKLLHAPPAGGISAFLIAVCRVHSASFFSGGEGGGLQFS